MTQTDIMANKETSLFVFLSSLVSSVSASWCYNVYNDIGDYYSSYDYCPFGCCGYYGNEYCCSATGPVTGIVFGMIAFIGIIIAIVICRRRRYGPVFVRNAGVNNGAFVTTTSSSSSMQSGAVMHAPPPQYPTQYPSQTAAYPQPPPYAPAGQKY